MLPPIFNLIILLDLIKLKPLKKQGGLKGREPLANPPVKRPQDKHGDGENTEYITALVETCPPDKRSYLAEIISKYLQAVNR